MNATASHDELTKQYQALEFELLAWVARGSEVPAPLVAAYRALQKEMDCLETDEGSLVDNA